MQKPESIRENETCKIVRDFEIQTGHLIPARRPDFVTDNKKIRTYQSVNIVVPGNHSLNIQRKRKARQVLGSLQTTKKAMDHERVGIPIVISARGMIPKCLVSWLENLEIEGGAGSVEITALLRSTRYLRHVLENWGDMVSFRFQGRLTLLARSNNNNTFGLTPE